MYGNWKIHNLLINLTDLERYYMEQKDVLKDFDSLAAYQNFFSHTFIQSNDLLKMYWPQIELPKHNVTTKLNLLDEAVAIAAQLNVAVLKKFSFSSPFPHTTNYFELQYVYQGRITLHWKNRTFELHEGDCFFIGPHAPFYFDNSPDGILIHIIVRRKFIAENYIKLFHGNPVALAFFDMAFSDKPEMHYLLFHTQNLKMLNNMILTMFDEYLNKSELSCDILEHLFGLFCCYLQQYRDGGIESSLSLEPQKMYYHAILDYLNVHYATATLDEIAGHMNFSKQYICKIVKANSGATFSHVLKKYRILAAQEYLINTNQTLETIAELTGFSDGAHLSRIFKEETGMTPSAFKKQNRTGLPE